LSKFRGQFIPRWVIERKKDDFYNCKQEGKNLGNYATEFTQLSKYCPVLVQEESDKVRQFVKGLQLKLNRALIGMAPSTYNDAVEISSRIEGENLEQTKQRNK
jgi:hypothetical protein